MSIEQNKAIARQLIEQVFNQGKTSLIDEILTADFVEHEELPPDIPPGREGVKVLPEMMHDAFPDFKATIDDLIAERDKVVVHMTWSGTQEGAFMGIPASGKYFTISVIDILRFSEGKIVEHWGVMDSMGMMAQLGATPGPG